MTHPSTLSLIRQKVIRYNSQLLYPVVAKLSLIMSGVGNGARVAAAVGTRCRGNLAGFILIGYPLKVNKLSFFYSSIDQRRFNFLVLQLVQKCILIV